MPICNDYRLSDRILPSIICQYHFYVFLAHSFIKKTKRGLQYLNAVYIMRVCIQPPILLVCEPLHRSSRNFVWTVCHSCQVLRDTFYLSRISNSGMAQVESRDVEAILAPLTLAWPTKPLTIPS
jgi:hypothetical protein